MIWLQDTQTCINSVTQESQVIDICTFTNKVDTACIKYITDHTKESTLLKTILGNNSHSNQDVRTVIHSLASHICDHIQRFMLCNKPSKLRDLNDTFPKTDSRKPLLAFGGTCMRLIYISAKRKGDMDIMKLIQNLKLTRVQRTSYISWVILSKRSSL